MEELQQKLLLIVECAMHDLTFPHSILTSLLLLLPFPPPPHIARVLLLRHLLSVTASRRPLNTLEILEALDLFRPRPPSPPPVSLCGAYSSLLFYLSLSPDVSASEVASSIAQIGNYQFSAEILGPWGRMVTEANATERSEVDRVANSRNKAILALKEFVEEQFGAMEPPFLLRAVEEWSRENKKVANDTPSRNSEKESSQANENQIHQSKPGIEIQNGTERNGACTSGTGGPTPIISLQKDLGENGERTKRKSPENDRVKIVNNTPKRRRVVRWQPDEEDMLRKAVNEFGKGNWKEILTRYPDEFIDRTEVDLKDKWRNMTRR